MVTGDTLVAVNKELLEAKGKLSDAIGIISKAKWPKILRFERKKRSVEEKKVKIGAGYLNVVWPRILQDEYPILRAQFSTHFPCGMHNISIAEPFEACKDISNAPMLQKRSIILVGRGQCTFSTKAYTGQDAGGHSVVMVNTEQKLLDMPAGNGKLDDLNTPMFSIGSLDGATIKVASRLLNGLNRFIVAKYNDKKDTERADVGLTKMELIARLMIMKVNTWKLNNSNFIRMIIMHIIISCGKSNIKAERIQCMEIYCSGMVSTQGHSKFNSQTLGHLFFRRLHSYLQCQPLLMHVVVYNRQ